MQNVRFKFLNSLLFAHLTLINAHISLTTTNKPKVANFDLL